MSIRRRRPGGHEITCRQAVTLMTRYLENSLDRDDRARLEAHLAECAHCAEHLRQIRITIAVTGRLREEDLDPIAREDLMALYRRWRSDPKPDGEIRVEIYTGPRADLRSLFELAEDSADQLDSYLDLGRVLVAVSGREVIGHLQLVDTGHPEQVEIKNMAVREGYRGRGVGRRLIDAAANVVATEGVTELLVATAAADTGNLRFYQRQGFRLRSVERDAFTAATGYPPSLRIDGIELRDRVWMDRPVQCSTNR